MRPRTTPSSRPSNKWSRFGVIGCGYGNGDGVGLKSRKTSGGGVEILESGFNCGIGGGLCGGVCGGVCVKFCSLIDRGIIGGLCGFNGGGGGVLVGVSFAKSVAYALDVPLIPVHHVRGHIAANYLAFPELEPPFLALAISGGNTLIMCVLAGFSFR